MMAPTKREGKHTKLVARPAVDLTRAERRMLELFRATTDQQTLLGIAAVCVKHCPRHKRPSLQLISGGAA